MNEKGVDLNGTLNWLAEYHGLVSSKFLAQYRLLSSLGPTADAMSAPSWRVAPWIRGIDYLPLETEGYLGAEGPKVKR